MFLHKLELQGFKSFVDRTTVEFGDGITGVIGPNGCGKTNVSDAIRWVMGEQSARQLRGDSMEDVIFGGCPTRKPVNLAEVHLTLKNDRGVLPTEYSEVTISRRMFRSGVSEYFLNKTPCRLKDIRDLFYGTGMGSHAYSVIERGMVDHVLSDNSGHRRFLFEEAAGITKYKARKKEALNKLDATEGDLTRLNDIVYELERELRSLARQVGKARRHQRLRDQIRDLDLKLTGTTVESQRTRERALKEQWQEEAVRREAAAAGLDSLEARLNDRKLALLELERELSTAQGGLRDREEARLRAEQSTVLLKERAEGLDRRATEAAEEIARIRERLEQVREEERLATARRSEVVKEIEDSRLDLEREDAEFQALDFELKLRRTAATERKQLSLDLFSTEAEKRGACERARERRHALAERREAARLRLEEMEQRGRELERRIEEVAGRRVGLATELDEARTMLQGVEAAIESANGEIEAMEGERSQAQKDQAGADARLQTLLELKREFEGVSEGVRALLTGNRPAGVLGVLADIVQVPARYLNALEASLGEASGFVLVENATARDAALQVLRNLDSGRATLVDLSAIAAGSALSIPKENGVLGRASELVRCDDRFRPLVDRLLGSVVMVENREIAGRLSGQSEGGLRFVSLDGEVWERGRVRAGSARNLSGLLHREAEIRELTGTLTELGMTLEALDRQREALLRRRTEAVQQRATAQVEVDRRRTALETLDRQLESTTSERGWAAEEAAARRVEIETLASEDESLARALHLAEAELAAFVEDLDRARAMLADLDGAVRAAEQQRDEAANRAQQSRELLLSRTREAAEWETRWARAEQTRTELEAALESRTQEERDGRGKIAAIEAEISGLSAGLAGLMDDESTQRARVGTLLQRFQAEKAEVQTGEDEARTRRFELTELAELLHSLELDRVQVRADLDLTFERLRTEYSMKSDEWRAEALPQGFDPEAARGELEALRERFQGLGPVNLLALDDYTNRKQRYEFLVQQRADLVGAKAQLLEAIEKINVTASDLFVDTFEKVQVHFRDIFKTLFEGGDAELRKNGEDPLECEIEIVAKPRGKHLQSISLMSGGERALTAIALLFALYLVKPSPFCLLDEVDAPLDDANVERFLRMVRRFSDRTQFVVITHNKKTMEAATRLYGVTMQELGVSTLVSVHFDGIDRGGRVIQPRETEEAVPV